MEISEAPSSGGGQPDWSAYEADGRPHNFVLVVKPAQPEGGRDLDEGSDMAVGVSQVLRRLAKELAPAAQGDAPLAAVGAATDGCSIVFVRLQVNTGVDRWERPFVATRTRVLRLSPRTSAAAAALRARPCGAARASAGDEVTNAAEVADAAEGAGSGAVPRGGKPAAAGCGRTMSPAGSNGCSFSDRAAAPLSADATRGATDAADALPEGFFGLLLVLSNAGPLLHLRQSPKYGIAPPPHEWRGYVPTGEVFAGGFGRVYILADKRGDAVAWKTVRYDVDCEQLQREHEVIAEQVPGCSNVVSCVDKIEGSTGRIEALVLRPVGRVVTKMPPGHFNIRDFIADMATALAAAHSRGVCHCDVRPANMIYAAGRYVLIDWGLSAASGTGRSSAHGVDSFLHDGILTCVSEGRPYEVLPAHDCASLAYSVLAILHGRSGRCPWPNLCAYDAELVPARTQWLADWLASDTPDTGERGWVRELISDAPSLESLRSITAAGSERRVPDAAP